jgi:RimJ/RimL family protein N-acetyltransferase
MTMSIATQPLGEKLPDTPPAKWPERVTLGGRTVIVRPLNAVADAPALFANTFGHDELWTYLLAGSFADRAAFDVYLHNMVAAPDRVAYAIVDKASCEATGLCCYLRIEPAHRTIEVGSIVYSPKLQQTAMATEAMYLMARYAFEELRYRRYEWRCNALNAASQRAALRLGFTREGIFCQHMIVKGRNRDTAWFAMLHSEWPARKAALEQWLAPSNFDDHGRQKKHLSEFQSLQASGNGSQLQ